jgi:hypothetical protein
MQIYFLINDTALTSRQIGCRSKGRDLFAPNPDQFCGLTRLNAVVAGSDEAE